MTKCGAESTGVKLELEPLCHNASPRCSASPGCCQVLLIANTNVNDSTAGTRLCRAKAKSISPFRPVSLPSPHGMDNTIFKASRSYVPPVLSLIVGYSKFPFSFRPTWHAVTRSVDPGRPFQAPDVTNLIPGYILVPAERLLCRIHTFHSPDLKSPV